MNAYKSFRQIVVPYGERTVHKYMFANCESLEEVFLPETVTSIEEGAFLRCKKLTRITFPKHLKEIGALAFMDCSKLERIELPATLKHLGYGAFAFCSSAEISLEDGFEEDLFLKEKHIFYGNQASEQIYHYYGRLNYSLHPAARSSVDEPVICIMKDLEHALNTLAREYIHCVPRAPLSCSTLSYSITIDEIDSPSEENIEEKVAKERWKQDIIHFINWNWEAWKDLPEWEGALSSTQSEFAARIIIDTLEHLDGEIFDASVNGINYYCEDFHCINLISLHFFHIRGKWYAMYLEEYD